MRRSAALVVAALALAGGLGGAQPALAQDGATTDQPAAPMYTRLGGGVVISDGEATVVVPDARAAVAAVSDPLRPAQWALDQVAYEAAWARGDGSGVVVAVVDTGVDSGHEDLAGAVLPGFDAIADAPGGGTDPHGHGTHVAGIIAGRRANAKGGSGAAPGARILPVRALAGDGSGWASDVAQGIVWATDNGADVINLSLGGPSGATVYRNAITYAHEHGVVVVAAAGNEALLGNPVVYPAASDHAIGVAAAGPDGLRAAFSSFGTWVDLAAPGTGIVAPCSVGASRCSNQYAPGGYSRLSGTSMAAPHVAAAAAVLLSAVPSLSPDEVESALESATKDLGLPGIDLEFGAGLVDPLRAVSSLLPAVAPAPTPSGPGSGPGAGAGAGYWVVGRDGRVAARGAAPVLGDLGGAPAAAQIVAAAGTPSGLGYWLAGADGAVYAFGDAPFLGSMTGLSLNAAIVGMAATATGQGYWLLAADGGVFSFGDAAFFGSTGSFRLNRPVVDMAPTPSGLGYWLVASDGGVFSFGDASFAGSTGGLVLNKPVTSLTPAPAGGYWLVGSDGGIFAFGVPFYGSLPGLGAGVAPDGARIRATDGGYYILGVDGQVFAFGGATAYGSASGFDAVDLVLVGG